MARRTIAEARSIYETSIRPTANSFAEERAAAILKAAEDRARAMASERAESEATEIAEAIRAAQRTLTGVRDELEALAAEGSGGRIDSATYSRRMREVTDRERRANADLRRLDERIEALSQIETDPIAWHDELARRMPSLRSEFPW